MNKEPLLSFAQVAKTFTLHLQGGVTLPTVRDVTFDVRAGECVALGGPSGVGKSSLLKMAYGNYRCEQGRILIGTPDGPVDITRATPREMLRLRARSISYVSQFLRVIPRVAAIDIVTAAGVEGGMAESAARARASMLLARLNVPERLWSLPPATFSGGEQQRVNIARGFCATRPLFLLDEPTASLDAVNRDVVVELVQEQKQTGAAVLGIFHDKDVRTRLADRVIDIRRFAGSSSQSPASSAA